jgi:hypothetical protein
LLDCGEYLSLPIIDDTLNPYNIATSIFIDGIAMDGSASSTACNSRIPTFRLLDRRNRRTRPPRGVVRVRRYDTRELYGELHRVRPLGRRVWEGVLLREQHGWNQRPDRPVRLQYALLRGCDRVLRIGKPSRALFDDSDATGLVSHQRSPFPQAHGGRLRLCGMPDGSHWGEGPRASELHR